MTIRKMAGGFSLLEMLLVVGVGTVIILSGIGVYKLVSEDSAAAQGTRQLHTIKEQVQMAYQNQPGYGTAGNQDLIPTLSSMRMLPTDMPVNGSALRNGFGSLTKITSGATTSTFIIEVDGVSITACNQMGMEFSTGTSSDFLGVTIGTTTPPTGTPITVPTISTLATACNNAASDNMAFEFH